MPRKRYNYPIGLTCEYPADLPRITDVLTAQRWIVSLQRDLASLHGQLDRLLGDASNPDAMTHADFQATGKLLAFNMAKIDAVQSLIPTMHKRLNVSRGKAPSASGPANHPLPTPPPVTEPLTPYDGIEYIPSQQKET